MSDQRTRDAEEAARKLGACLDDVHVNCVLLLPGEERVDGVVRTCSVQIPHHARVYLNAPCGNRPLYRCTDCGAFVCKRHAGKLCPAVDDNGKRCVLRLAPDPHGYHHHEYAR